MNQNLTFEDQFRQLDSIVKDLGQGNLTLEQVMNDYQKGTQLGNALANQLQAAKQHIKRLEVEPQAPQQSEPPRNQRQIPPANQPSNNPNSNSNPY